ncbi:nectin-2 isoform X2 [Oreochromis niloticus]|uniref:nectin-2 isoform X2 n=1 Tax=Oreochromis niloticus TaxID=8128 RepID=UPI000DF13DB5|nr:nectin-2 isoform X2 [Oreochromis niloticus]
MEGERMREEEAADSLKTQNNASFVSHMLANITNQRSVDGWIYFFGGSYCDSMSSLLLPMVVLQCTYVGALQVIGGSVTVIQGGTAILPCHVIDTNDDLTQISWQRKTREKPHNDNFLTILPREGPQFVNGGDDRFKYIGNFNEKNGTLQLANVALKDEGRYTCIFTLFPSGNQKTEIPLNLLVPPFTNVKDNLPTLGKEEVLFATCTAAGSKPPAEVRWLTGALGDKVRTTTNSTHYDNDTTTTVSSLFGVPTREINGHQVQCVISGDSFFTEETLPFTIQVYFSPTEVNIRAISEDSFECVTEANPSANFTWSSLQHKSVHGGYHHHYPSQSAKPSREQEELCEDALAFNTIILSSPSDAPPTWSWIIGSITTWPQSVIHPSSKSVSTFRFPGAHISANLTWTQNTIALVKKAQ